MWRRFTVKNIYLIILLIFIFIVSGCIPVILSDNYGVPYTDFLDWSKFSIKWPQDQVNMEYCKMRKKEKQMNMFGIHYVWVCWRKTGWQLKTQLGLPWEVSHSRCLTEIASTHTFESWLEKLIHPTVSNITATDISNDISNMIHNI